MPQFTLTCDQAIFTSVRSPTGEGYRIIAASKGLKPEERQVITRYCPSHEGLCAGMLDAESGRAVTPAVSFFELPTNRLCVIISTTAGAEHTGRGGQRVYSHIAVFSAQDFASVAFNPFAVARAMVEAGLAAPELKPQQVLPELVLSMGDTAAPRGLKFAAHIQAACRKHVLSCMLGNRNVVLDVGDSWLETAELFLLGVPGPLRAKTSVAAGLKFSAGRCQRLNVTQDEKNVARNRSAGQPIEFVEPENAHAPDAPSIWVTFVDKRWEKGELAALTRCTGKALKDTSPMARERLGKLYDLIDDVVSIETPKLLSALGEFVTQLRESKEPEVVQEFLSAAARELTSRFRRQSWPEVKPQWTVMLALWRRSFEGRALAAPLLHTMLRIATGPDMLDAAETAIEWLRLGRGDLQLEPGDQAVLDDLFSRMAAWADVARDFEAGRLRRVTNLLSPLRPNCPIVDRMRRRCEMLEAVSAASHP